MPFPRLARQRPHHAARWLLSTGLAVVVAGPLAAQADSGLLTLERIGRGEFEAQGYGPIRWAKSGASYTVFEPSATVKEAEDLVQYEVATERRTVLVPASRLIPPGDSVPIDIEDFAWSPAGPALLIYTNSQRVWRQRTRGDYWLVDTTSWPRAPSRPRSCSRRSPPTAAGWPTCASATSMSRTWPTDRSPSSPAMAR